METEMTKAMVKISGNTYPHRGALRGFGALFNYDEKAYFCVLSENVQQYCRDNDLEIESVEFDIIKVTPATGEDLRAIRQAKIDRRKERLYERAERATARASKHNLSSVESDFLSLMEPVKVGHHSERPHRKLLDRAQTKMTKRCKEYSYANELIDRADSMQKAAIKGDAENARDKKRAAFDEKFKEGSIVFSYAWGDCEIIKMNKKSVRVRRKATGSEFNGDKSRFELLSKEEIELVRGVSLK